MTRAPWPDVPLGDQVYIASKTRHADRWRRLAANYPISSTWIFEAGPGDTKDFEDLWSRCLTEAAGSKALVLYREHGEELKGAWIELGAALANGVPVHATGIEEFTVAKFSGITHHESFGHAFIAACGEPSRALVASVERGDG